MTQPYPPGQHYPPPPWPPQQVVVVKNSMATAAMVLGIIALLFCWIPIVGVIAWPLAILGVIFGMVGMSRARDRGTGKGPALAGLITSGLALAVCVIYVVAIGAATSPTTGASPARALPAATPPAAEVPAAKAPAAPGVAGPLTTIGDGTYQVGTDVVAGRYKTPGPPENSFVKNCYWERSKDDSGEFGSIISNSNSQGPASVTVKKGEFFQTTGGCTWTKQ